MEHFYMIWCEDNRAPTMKHLTKELAEEEAERLSALLPGRNFYILEVVELCFASAIDGKIIWHRDKSLI
jgi:hypothetical protein